MEVRFNRLHAAAQLIVACSTMVSDLLVCMLQSAIDEAKVNLNKTRAAFQHVIDKAKDPNADP